MKRLLLVALVGLSLTGCAQLEAQLARQFKSPIELAKEDCTKMGYTPNTSEFLRCVQNTSNQIRQSRAIESTAPRYNSNLHNPIVSCRQIGSFVNCTEL